MAQVVECLLSKHKALSSKLQYRPKEKKFGYGYYVQDWKPGKKLLQ
jgi:hypothetical protein